MKITEISCMQPYQLACRWINVFVPAASLIRTAIITPFEFCPVKTSVGESMFRCTGNKSQRPCDPEQECHKMGQLVGEAE